MLKYRRRLPAAALTALTLAALGAAPSFAQEGNTLGPPQIRDFQLKGERRTPPAQPQQVQPVPAPAPAPAAERRPASPAPSATQPAERPSQRATEPRERPAAASPAPRAEERRQAPAIPSAPQEVFQLPEAPAAVPEPAVPAPQAAEAPAEAAPVAEGRPFWQYLIPAGLLVLGLAFFLRRRRRSGAAAAIAVAEREPVAATPPAPRPAPIPRPWLEIELKAERAVSTDKDASLEFELVLRNTGKSPARNIRLNAKMFNAGKEQDKEIGAFFRAKGEGRKTHTLGDLPADEQGLVQGTVSMPREEMRALRVNDQLLFVPVLAVNVIYDWGEGRTGQTSKSYVIGRELGADSEKMGAFRLDLGPRIYRTVGQRQHSLAKRV
jgi:MYXO-CTERM domain-containing protein